METGSPLTCLVTPTGFEPMIPPWKGGVLTAWPWGHRLRCWWLRTDSNHRPVGYEPNALASWATQPFVNQLEYNTIKKEKKQVILCPFLKNIKNFFFLAFADEKSWCLIRYCLCFLRKTALCSKAALKEVEMGNEFKASPFGRGGAVRRRRGLKCRDRRPRLSE